MSPNRDNAGVTKAERRKSMMTLHQNLRRRCKGILLVGAVLSVLWSSPFAFAAEREGPVLFLSVEDLQIVLSHPSSLSLPTYRLLAPGFAWQEWSSAAEQEGPVEQSFRWGNGLGIDSYTRPGTRPLWGY